MSKFVTARRAWRNATSYPSLADEALDATVEALGDRNPALFSSKFRGIRQPAG